MASITQDLQRQNDPNYLGFSRGADVPAAIRPTGQSPNQIEPIGAKFKGAEYEGNKAVNLSGLYSGRAEQFKGEASKYVGESEVFKGESAKYAGQATAIGLKGEGLAMASLGQSLEDIGSIANLGAREADFLIKKNIDNSVYEAVDRERDAFTSALQTVASAAPTGTGVATDTSDTDTIPDEVERVAQRIENLQNSYAGGGTPRVHYLARLDEIAREVRTRHPGYREYIDAKISQVTGVTPANALIASYISAINQANTAAAAKANKMDTFFKQNMGIPGWDEKYVGWKNGKYSDTEVLLWANQDKTIESGLRRRHLQREDAKGTREDRSVAAQDDMILHAQSRTQQYLDNIETAFGATKPQKLMQFIDEMAAGTKPPPDERQAGEIAALLQSQKRITQQKILEEFRTQFTPGRSLSSDYGNPQKERQIVEDATKVFDDYTDAVIKGDYALAKHISNGLKAREDQARKQLFDSPAGEAVMRMKILEKDSPEFAKQFFLSQLGKTSEFNESLNNFVFERKVDMLAQPDLRTGFVHTQKSTINATEGAGATKGATFQDVINAPIDTLTNPKSSEETKLKAAQAMFDRTNIGVLDKFNVDYRDPQTGREVPGKFAVFNRMTSPAVLEELTKLSKKNPWLMQDYLAWIGTEYGKLFQNDIQSLRGITYDKLAYKDGIGFTTIREGPYQERNPRVERILNRLNYGIRRLRESGKAAGLDETSTEANIFNTLVGMGYRPNAPGVKRPDLGDIGQSMIDALKAWGTPKKDIFEP